MYDHDSIWAPGSILRQAENNTKTLIERTDRTNRHCADMVAHLRPQLLVKDGPFLPPPPRRKGRKERLLKKQRRERVPFFEITPGFIVTGLFVILFLAVI